MNGQHVLFKPEPLRACPPPPEVRQRLKALRDEFAQKVCLIKRRGHPLGK